MYELKQPEDAIDDVLNKCDEQEDEGGSKWPGMTYEQGVAAGIRWALGHIDDNPMEDE